MIPFAVVVGIFVLMVVGYNVRTIKRVKSRRDGEATLAMMYIILAVAFFIFVVFALVANNHPGLAQSVEVKERYQGATLYFDNESKEYFTVSKNLMSFDNAFEKEVIPTVDVHSGEWKGAKT